VQETRAAGGVFVSVPFGAEPDWRTGTPAVEYTPRAGDQFVVTLAREIAGRAPAFKGRTFSTVYFGGCGPSCLSLDQLYRILAALYDSLSIVPVEQTLVVLPGTVDPSRAKVLAESGFDRVELRATKSGDMAGDFAVLREAGFRTVGLELVDASGNQDTVDLLLRLEPDHVVLAGSLGVVLAGYLEYLPQHFCRPGHECRHLLDSAAGQDSAGFGPGAASRTGSTVLHNPRPNEAWARAAKHGRPEAG